MKNITDMKTLKEALFNKKNLSKSNNPYGITKDDMIRNIKGFPVGVVVRMMEEQEAQGNKPDVGVFQYDRRLASKGFQWEETEGGQAFWDSVITMKKFKQFFEKYPEYERYN